MGLVFRKLHQNRRQKVFNRGFSVLRGGFAFVRGGLGIIKLTKIPLKVFHVSIWGSLELCLGG